MKQHNITGNLVDCFKQEIYPVKITITQNLISTIQRLEPSSDFTHLPYILPGFIDAHIHIESSMLVPAEFARLDVVPGTIATVSDPHEIANVCGLEGVDFMISNGHACPFKFYFGARMFVPSTSY